jgi:hypothetical protein
MLWLAGKMADKPGWWTRKQVVLAACDCAETALKYVKAGEDRPQKAIETARQWAKGEATLQQVRAAAAAAYAASAYAASAAAAVAAADAAADAVASADAAVAAADAAAAVAAADAAAAAVVAAAAVAAVAADAAAADARAKALAGMAEILRKTLPLDERTACQG